MQKQSALDDLLKDYREGTIYQSEYKYRMKELTKDESSFNPFGKKDDDSEIKGIIKEEIQRQRTIHDLQKKLRANEITPEDYLYRVNTFSAPNNNGNTPDSLSLIA